MGTATTASVAGGVLRRLENQWGLIPSTLQEGMKWPLLILNYMMSTASAKQPVDEMMGAWTTEINQVLYDAEDLMDDLEGRPISKRTFFLSPCSLLWRITMTHRIKTISRKLDIGSKASLELVPALKASPHAEQHESIVNVHEATLIGRCREKEEIKDLLMQNDGETLSILSIVGLPGMGKTSLARLLFDDKGEGWDFDLRIWISLGKPLDLRNIAACIISKAKRSVEEGLSQFTMNDPSLEWMKNKVQEVLDKKSCLIVLDNLWSADDSQLIYLKEMFGAKQKCIKVIVTTRSEKVAELTSTVSLYKLGCIPEDDSWAIFTEKAFLNGNAVADSQYTEIGKDIVKRCKGFPLLVQSLGSLVRNQGLDTWLAVRDEDLWKLEERLEPEAKLFTSFKKIYYSMPLGLKSCFLYLSVFPKGYSIDKYALIQQWDALDLLWSNRGVIPSYQVGEGYIQDLLSISFLHNHDRSLKMSAPAKLFLKKSAPAKLQMHDLVHEFVRYIARDLVVLDYGGNAQDENSAKLQFRYAVLSNCYGLSSVRKDLIVRSKAVHFRNCKETKEMVDAFSLLGHSRTINLSGCPITELPASIGKLKNLRYLDVSDSGIETLPNEVSCLRNLESLDLAKTCIKVIPSFVGSFQKLKYFNLHGCEKIQKLPPTLGSLEKLEHLNLSCCTGIGELPVSLCSLLQLRLLDLSGCTKLQELPNQLGNLKGLKHLNLAGCSRLKKLPKFLDKIPFLMYINLASCCELQEIPERFSLNKHNSYGHLTIR